MRKLLLGLAIFTILVLSHSVYADFVSEQSTIDKLFSIVSSYARWSGDVFKSYFTWYGSSTDCGNGYVYGNVYIPSNGKPIDKDTIRVYVTSGDASCRVSSATTSRITIKCTSSSISPSNCPKIIAEGYVKWEKCPYTSQDQCPQPKYYEKKTCAGDRWKIDYYDIKYYFDGCDCVKKETLIDTRYEEIQVPEPKVEEEFLGCVDNVTGMAEFGVTKTTYYVENCEIKKQVTTDIITKFDERCLSGATPVPPTEEGQVEKPSIPYWIVLVVLVGVLILFWRLNMIQRFLSRH